MANYGDNRLSKAQRQDIVKFRKHSKKMTKSGDQYAHLADKAYRQVKAGR